MTLGKAVRFISCSLILTGTLLVSSGRSGVSYTGQRQIFETHNFRGLAFSKISRKQFSRITDSAIAAIRRSKISRSLIFDSMQFAKNEKIMRRDNLTLYVVV